MSTLGSRLRDARERKGWSQTDVCKKLKMSNSTLSGYERDYRRPDPDMIRTFSELYEVSTDYLHGKSGSKDKSKAEETYDDPDFQLAMRSAQGFSKENKQRIIDTIKMLEEVEKARDQAKERNK